MFIISLVLKVCIKGSTELKNEPVCAENKLKTRFLGTHFQNLAVINSYVEVSVVA